MAALKAATQFARAAAAQAANASTMHQAEPRSPTSPAAQQFMHQVHAAAAALFAAQAAAHPTARTTQKPQQAMRPQQQQAARPQQQQPQRVQPARPARPVASHPDDAFFTGAWMFDASSAPAWLAAELAPRARGRVVTVARKPAQAHATVSVSVRRRTSPVRPEDPDVGFTSGAWLFDASAAPAWMQAQLPKVPKTQATQTPRPVSGHPQMQTARAAAAPTVQSRPATATPMKMSWATAVQAPRAVREDPDDAFSTGAWMFDASRVPAWMAAQLPKSAPAVSKRNARAAK
ncbi:hypothetical protein GGF31_007590 [Allomyces arbusculus]|nr:hypothetical protein GGF31_007590 [Allomyces arbusculus]